MIDHFIHTPDDPRVFVFGSNMLGIHGAGAARYAHQELGAVHSKGEGLFGRSYALPTCSVPGVPLSLSMVMLFVKRFLDFAAEHPELRFFVSEVGCGLAGFQPEEIAPFFSDVPANVDLPSSFAGTR